MTTIPQSRFGIPQWVRGITVPQWVLTVVGAYAIQATFTILFGQFSAAPLAKPIRWLPIYLYTGWDATYYRGLFYDFNVYVWPPLYPLTLRFLAWLLHIGGSDAFDKCAVILNLVCHSTIAWGIGAYLKGDARLKDIPAWVPVFLIFFFPGHNVFFAAYSESYYLALTVVALLLYQRGHIGWAAIFAGAAAWTRLMGVFLAAAMVADQLLVCLRSRRVAWRPLLLSSLAVLIAVSWHVTLHFWGTSSNQALAEWFRDLIENHVPPGVNPKLWVFSYLAFSWRAETVAFWVSIVAAVICGWKKRYVEMFYIAAFNCSLLVNLYRPFPWTRYVSVLFPIQLVVAGWLRDRPRLTCTVLMICAAISCYMQMQLFLGRFGEP